MEWYDDILDWFRDLRFADVVTILFMGAAELAWVAFMVWAVL